MGLLKNAISSGLSEGITGGIKKAVENAAEGVLKPAVDKYAEAASEQLSASANAMNKGVEELKEAGLVAHSETTNTPGAGLSDYVNDLKSFATEVAKGMKECPQCGEVCEADRKFCPNCGAALPKTTMAQGVVCPKCGKQNTIGTRFCAECGTVLPASAEEVAKERAEREMLAKQEQEEQERRTQFEAKKSEVTGAVGEKLGAFREATSDIRDKAAEVGGQAVNAALDAATGLFKKFGKKD